MKKGLSQLEHYREVLKKKRKYGEASLKTATTFLPMRKGGE